MKSAILGKKIGMTSVFTENGTQVPVTVIEAGPCTVVNLRTIDRDGYKAVQIGYGEVRENKLNKPDKGYFAKQGVEPVKMLKEFRDPKNTYEVGQELTVGQFEIGDKVNVVATSKGRGFQGVMKRHHFGGVGMGTHGQSDRQRHPGSIGSSSYPSRVFKGMRMAGRMGGKRISIRNIQVFDILPERNIILLKGSIPGPNNSVIQIVKL
ncbi:MAG: 50S ribosomal protein L3 [Ignavibacteriae bacterium HGW-Ignavibacteriae-1]|jgi:large subunit ribosomal protein L3|nr:MAG: 50S ribosomal protein L3 [Ignavibacteriae bacterium HGW-Ignavibacteriae-1]